MQHDFAASAQSHAEGRRHNGLRRILERHVGLLESVYGGIELIPFAFLGREQDEHEICADAEVLSLVGDNHRLKIPGSLVQAGVDHRNLILPNGVHLAVNLQAQNAVANVHQRCSRMASVEELSTRGATSSSRTRKYRST